MSTTQTTTFDKVTNIPNGVLHVREIITKTDTTTNQVVYTGFQRRTIVPGADVSNENIEIKNLASKLWTTDVINAFKSEAI